MKKILIILVLFPILVIGQTQSQNYIKNTIYKNPVTASIVAPTALEAVQSVTYFDGLGKPIQRVDSKQSASGKNIVTHIEYDVFGRQVKEYLPYTTQSTSGLDYESSASTDVLNYPKYTGQTPFSEKQLEASPLDRMFMQGSPGNDWALGSGHEKKIDYLTNIASEVKYYKASAVWNATSGLYNISISDNGNYQANLLYKTVIKNENWVNGNDNTIHEFNDKEGNLILTRTFESSVAHDTYYVYDQFGNLTYVIPPLVTNVIAELDYLCYQYKYDRFNRLIEKKLPGKQWEFLIYDKLNRLVATGPAFSPWGDSSVGVLISEYDAYGRVKQTGWKMNAVTGTSRTAWQNTINTGGSNPFVLSANDILTKNYYDNYILTNAPNPLPTTLPNSTYPITANVKGLVTGSWVRVLTLPTELNGETSYILYDDKYHPVRTHTTNYLSGYTQTDNKLDFTGKAEYTITRHKRLNGDSEIVVKDMFTYSDQDRLTLHKQQVNTLPEQLIVSNTYDELGQLISKNVGGEDATGALGLQKVNYKYNIRGWLEDINDIAELAQGTDPSDLFSFKINYKDVDMNHGAYNVPPLYNGNISETFWKTSSDNVLRKYGYTYDNLNRLTGAIYQKPDSSTPVTNSYNESLGYDKNGNITQLTRTGEYDDEMYQLTIDDLVYSYDGNNRNQLAKVFDNTNNPKGFADDSGGLTDDEDDYGYDANGNMISDTNKGIVKIKYNHLNLPTEIDINNGSIFYIYNALGQKVQKTAPEYVGGVVGVMTKVTDYLAGGFQYKDGILLFFPHAEGYVNVLGSAGNLNNNYNYVFNYTDHLGNVRLSYGVDPQTQVLTILEESNYYPFGLKHANYNVSQKTYIKSGLGSIGINENISEFKYKYNGKELQDELGLNMYDYGARNYDPAIGRWMNIDPLAEANRRFSPYIYANNNPIFFIDPDGRYSHSFDSMNPNDTEDAFKASPDDWKRDAEGKMVFDPTLTAANQNMGKLQLGERYIGPESESVENGMRTLYNNDGTKHTSRALDEVIVERSISSNKGESYGISASGAIGGGIGFEVGVVKDATNNWGGYFSFKSNFGYGEDVGINTSEINPTHDGPFLLKDFEGTSIEISAGVNSPLGGGGVSFGGTSPKPGKSIGDRFLKIGTDKRGYTTGAISPELFGPSANVKGGVIISKTNTSIWDF